MFLPRSSQRGFTLIELMVAIAIVAILSTVGLVVFGNTQKQARDSRRTQDVSAIANAIQAKRPAGSIYYADLVGADFSNGNIPTDPRLTRWYCLYALTTIPPAAPPTAPTTNWGDAICPTVGGIAGIPVNNASSLNLNAALNVVTSWTICAALESSTEVRCQQNKL